MTTNQSQVSGPCSNPLLARETLSLAAVLEMLEADTDLASTRRRDLCSAVRRISGLIGRDPRMLPAQMIELKKGLASVHPVEAGVSEKTLQNLKSGVAAALRHVGANRAPHTARVRLSSEWSALEERLPSKRLRNGLSRLMRYCSAVGVRPGDVADAVMSDFMVAVRDGTFVSNPDELHRRTTRIWNEAVETVQGWPSQRLAVPDFRKPRETRPLTDFPEPFQRDVEAHLEWLRGDDPFAEEAPPKACKPRTIALRRKHIELGASAYVGRGNAIEDLQTLADLVVPERVKETLRAYLEHKDGKKTDFARALATTLIYIARHWVKADGAQLEELKVLRRCLGPAPGGLTAKNRATLRQFQDEENLARLLTLPAALFAEALASKADNRRTAVKAQIALAIELLTMTAVRMDNLIELRLDRNIVRPGGKRGRVHIVLHESETKNEEPLEFELPPHLKEMLDLYLERFRPLLADENNPYLFPGAKGGRKSHATLRQQIGEIIQRRTGLRITPHQFRHLAADLMLADSPGAYAAVNRLLGHKNMRTTLNFYAGLQTKSAARHYDRTILKMRERLGQPHSRRRRRAR